MMFSSEYECYQWTLELKITLEDTCSDSLISQVRKLAQKEYTRLTQNHIIEFRLDPSLMTFGFQYVIQQTVTTNSRTIQDRKDGLLSSR